MAARPHWNPRQTRAVSSVTLLMLLMSLILMVVVESVVGVGVPEAPTAQILVRVRKRRAPRWDVWQINSNVCPPSLCRSSSEDSAVPPPRPRGTGGSVFYQGDIVLDKEVDHFIFPEANQTRYRRATVRLRNRLWKDGVVPYVMSRTINVQARRVILRAFKHISQKTCITFREKKESDTDFIKFISEPGCWSAIGQSGGRQLLSIGRGCENVGTVVHEIFHSLGVWHEQARKDRDKYVRIIEDNISDRFLKDFEKVGDQVSTSRGYPYDYTSVMHYSRFAFTRNGKPTIEVIGVGKDLGLTIRQRSGLSTIDMAQLRDMYRCNLHEDTNKTSCPEGWYQHETSCYQFFDHPKVQFAAALKKCQEHKSHLVWIESKREDQFLAHHLQKKFPFVYTWRIGARRMNDRLKWYRGKEWNPVDMEYTNWATGHPGSHSTAALQRNEATNVTQWEGVWAGSMAQLPFFMYPFICERRAKRKCLKLRHKDGRDYRGKLDHTIDGYTCQKWTDHYPHRHNLTKPNTNVYSSKEDSDGLGDHNFCRNPKKRRRSRPWCYTTKKTHGWQLCDVTTCSSSASGSSRGRPAAQPPSRRVSPSSTPGRGRRHSSRPSRGAGKPTLDAADKHDIVLPDSSSSPSNVPSRRSGRRERRKGKGRRRSGKKERRMREGGKRRKTREGSRRRRGRRQRKRNRKVQQS